MDKLRTNSISSNILYKSNIGLWAFELDEGRAPRMYVDDTMFRLLGFREEVTPEELFHSWYDRIDGAHYKEVAAAVEKMKMGIRAEVQFPWHGLDGVVQIVRFGGTRNNEYTKGFRIEGCHQNVTDLMHFQKKSATELLAALSDTFSCLYFVNPQNGDYEFYLNDNNIEIDSVLATLEKRVNFFEDTRRDILQVVIPEDWHIVMKALSKENFINISKTGETQSFEVRWFYGKSREIIWVKEKLIRTKDENGTYKVVVGFENITHKKEQEIKLRNALDQTKRQLDIISSMTGMFYGSYYINVLDNSFIELNPIDEEIGNGEIRKVLDTSGDAQRAFDDMCKRFVISPNQDEVKKFTRLSTINKRLKNKVAISVQFEGPTLGWLEIIFVAADRDDKGNCKHVVFAVRDIDEQKRKEIRQQEEIRAALADPLTGSRNRTAMGWAYKGDYDHSTSVAIIECDLNGLKGKNDTEGHAAGDRYICKAASLLMEVFGEYNVYRVGGDEFVTISLGIKEDEFEKKLYKFMERCNESDVSLSIGYEYREVFDEPFEILLKEADLKMYKAKRAHYEKTKYDRRRADRDNKLYSEIMKALSDNFETVLYVDCDNDEIRPYLINSAIPKKQKEYLESSSSYSEVMDSFVKNVVAKEDREQMRSICDMKYLEYMLKKNKSITNEYKSIIDKEEVTYRIKFANMDGEGQLHRMVIGFVRANIVH